LGHNILSSSSDGPDSALDQSLRLGEKRRIDRRPGGGDILIYLLHAGRANDGGRHVGFAQDPSEGELGQRQSGLSGLAV
jgi:hypothetical protein